MIFKLFSPIQGQYSTYDGDIDGAKLARQNLIESDCPLHLGEVIGDLIPSIAQEMQIASNYLEKQHGITQTPLYFYTVYNVDTGNQRMCALYVVYQPDGSLPEVKVTDSVVTEQYVTISNTNTQSLNIVTNEEIEYYKYVDKDLNICDPSSPQLYALAKYDLSGNLLALNINATYDQLPEDKKVLLANFPYKNTIFQYKNSTDYGFVVFYTEPITLPPTQAQIDEATVQWHLRWDPEYSACEVTVLENGDETWTPIDLGAA